MMPDTPVQPLTVLDWNFDGVNDVVLVTSSAVYGWAQVRRPQSTSYSMLVAALVLVLIIVYASNWQAEDETFTSASRKGRSTDQVD